MLRKTKNKLTWLALILLLLVTLFSGTFPIFVIVVIGLIVYNIFGKKSTKGYKERKKAIEGFLTHQYGEEMGNYIMSKATGKK